MTWWHQSCTVSLERAIHKVRVEGGSLLVEHLGNVGGHDNEGSSSVNRCARVLKLELLLTKADLLELDLPVALSAEGNVLELAVKGSLVKPAEGDITAVLLRAAEAEAKNRLIEQLLREHVVEWRDDVVHRDGVVRETEDAVKFAKGKGESGFLDSLGKVLVLDREITNRHGVLRDITRKRAGTVADLKGGPVGLVRG